MEENLTIILQKPQLAENIGMAIRAMANCGVFDLRLVNPLCGWPNKKAELASAEKLELVNVTCFQNLVDALADLDVVFAASARARDMIKETYSPEILSESAHELINDGRKIGVLFGPENNGLSNEDVSYCSHLVCIESQNFSSYNLAQAVLIICYEFMKKNFSHAKEPNFHIGKTESATVSEINEFIKFFEKKLEDNNYFHCEEKQDTMMITLRNFFARSGITKQELNSLFGAVSALRN